MSRARTYTAIAVLAFIVGGVATYASASLYSWHQVINASGLPAEVDTYSGYPLAVWRVAVDVSFVGVFGQKFFALNALVDSFVYALISGAVMAAAVESFAAARKRRPPPGTELS